MEDKIHPIITKPHEYEVTFFAYKIDNNDDENSYIDIHFKKGDETVNLRFYQPTELQIEQGFYGNVCGMEIIDISGRQLSDVSIKVTNFEQDSGITFLAKKVVKLDE